MIFCKACTCTMRVKRLKFTPIGKTTSKDRQSVTPIKSLQLFCFFRLVFTPLECTHEQNICHNVMFTYNIRKLLLHDERPFTKHNWIVYTDHEAASITSRFSNSLMLHSVLCSRISAITMYVYRRLQSL